MTSYVTSRDGARIALEGQDHGASAEAVAPVVAEFLRTGSPVAAASNR
jgi:hypothetical protein